MALDEPDHRVEALADAGATWWTESDWSGATVDSLRARIAGGPPRPERDA